MYFFFVSFVCLAFLGEWLLLWPVCLTLDFAHSACFVYELSPGCWHLLFLITVFVFVYTPSKLSLSWWQMIQQYIYLYFILDDVPGVLKSFLHWICSWHTHTVRTLSLTDLQMSGLEVVCEWYMIFNSRIKHLFLPVCFSSLKHGRCSSMYLASC